MTIALVDCNNFFVSCERVFNPKLEGRPVVVLSFEGGIIIARSNEAKALGIPMGGPFFEYRKVFEEAGGIALTSNFALYSDLSDRVMNALEFFSPQVQVYSIDEAFLDFSLHSDPEKQAKNLRQKLLQWTGIPVSVGLAETKTLAKMASHQAKKEPGKGGVFRIDKSNQDQLLKKTAVQEIWGIGKKLASKLHQASIFNAYDFCHLGDVQLRRLLSVVGLRIAWELQGRSCLGLEEVSEPQQSITSSRTFARPVRTFEELKEACASYTAKAAEKLRQQGLVASSFGLFLLYHPYRSGSESIHCTLEEPTSNTSELFHTLTKALERLYKQGREYRKAGVHLDGLLPYSSFQRDLFAAKSPLEQQKKERAMQALDAINRSGKKRIRIASEGFIQPWKSHSLLRSPLYTTSWESLPLVKCSKQ